LQSQGTPSHSGQSSFLAGITKLQVRSRT
jgi:hypothetical protein